jgi:iron complex outermembrane recepter protein
MNKHSRLFQLSKLGQSIKSSVTSIATRPTNRSISRWFWAMTLTSGALVSATYGQEGELEEIQVTGSRIVRTTMETPTPVTTVQASDLAQMAPGSLIDGLSQMPMFYGNATPESTVGGQNSGGSNVNLRGAGARRTLTLLDGRRIVPSNRFGSVDVNVIPEDLLKSVESVTGGASASYGTDAVAGVVNFLLDTNYEGFKTHSQTGITEYGDGSTWEMGFAGGMQVTEKLHVIGSFAAADQAKISSFSGLNDRDFMKTWSRVTNPNTNGPTELVRPYVIPTNFSRTGVIVEPTVAALNRLEFQPDGSLKPLNVNGIGNVNGGCLCIASGTPTYGVNDDTEITNEFRRYNSFVYADYDVNEDLSVFFQGMYSDNATSDQNQSIHFTSGLWQTRIYADNAFLKPAARDLILANRPANAQYVTYGLLTESSPDTVLGEPRMETNNQMYSLTTGFNGSINSDGFFNGWSYNGYAQYGKVKQDVDTTNAIRTDRMNLALDAVTNPATGQIVCRVNLPEFTGPIASGGNGGLFKDCVPLNTFGGTQNISKAAADYIVDRDGKTARQWTHQESLEFVMSGDIAEGFGAGTIAGAFGGSYRKEELRQLTPDPSDEFPAQVDGTLLSAQGIHPAPLRGLVPQGNTTAYPGYSGIPGLRFVPNGFLGDGNSSSVLFTSLRKIAGGFNVKEAFGELNVPLLSDVAFVDYLEINSAVRWADYSGSGDIWAWKMGLNWTVNDQLRFRATQSRDVRAASLQERYDQTRGGVNVRNPWTATNLQVSAASLSGGNPNVAPEEADTITAGFVYQPSFLEGLSASVDWYSIDISDAIAQVANQNIVDNCRLGDLTFCQYVITPTGPVTNPTTATNVIIDRVESLFINLANQHIEGADVELGYRTDVSLFGGEAESLGARFLYSWLGENSTKNPGAIRQDLAGQISGAGLPENKITTSLTYMNGSFTTFLQARWIDGGKLLNNYLESDKAIPLSQRPAGANLATCGTNICTIDDNSIPSITYLDLRVGKTFGDNDQLEVFGNINNLLDREPNITAGAIGRTGVIGYVQQNLYDILGRRYTVGLNYEF